MDTCTCSEMCRMNCDYGSNLDRDACECVWWLEVSDCDLTCEAPQELDEILCECVCSREQVCSASNKYWDSDTCACETTDCVMDCPKRFELDVEACECQCNETCENPEKPTLVATDCKCIKDD